jgi:predicted dehydrogenase
MTRRLQVAVIGLGSMGQRYVEYFRHLRKTTVVGCDPRRKTFPVGVVCVETLSELLDTTTPDVVVIASPAAHHLETLYAVRAHHPDCAVLLEKPVSNQRLTQRDLGRCKALLNSTIAVGYCWRFHPYARQLHAVRQAIRDVTFYVGSDMRTWPGENYADPLREFSHELDLVTYLTTAQHIDEVGFTPQGCYQIDGTHQFGRWSVRIAPFQSTPGRWVKVVMSDRSVVTHHWDVRPRIIEAMYRSQAAQVTHATGPEGLLCPLRSGLQTTLLIDEIDSRLDAKGKAWQVM